MIYDLIYLNSFFHIYTTFSLLLHTGAAVRFYDIYFNSRVTYLESIDFMAAIGSSSGCITFDASPAGAYTASCSRPRPSPASLQECCRGSRHCCTHSATSTRALAPITCFGRIQSRIALCTTGRFNLFLYLARIALCTTGRFSLFL
jgi:hypothetical protein